MRPTNFLLLLLLLVTACADEFIEPVCEEGVQTVVRGSLRGHEVDIELEEVSGGLDEERFWLSFPSPETTPEQDAGDWVLIFGFNPLQSDRAEGAPVLQDMLAWFGQVGGPKPFYVTNKTLEERCDVLRGEMCGGFGVDPDRSGSVETQDTDAERYHRIKEGVLAFSDMRSEHVAAEFRLEVDADEAEPTILGGELNGCFDAFLMRDRGRTYFE